MTPSRLTNERVALYRRVLGEAWDSLPEPLRAMHDLDGERSADGVAVVERRSGLLALVCDSDRMRLLVRRWRVCGIPMPRALAPRGNSYEFAQAGRFHFHVEIA